MGQVVLRRGEKVPLRLDWIEAIYTPSRMRRRLFADHEGLTKCWVKVPSGSFTSGAATDS